MIEVRWHGRGGQGGFTVARVLGIAASVYEHKYAQAFPSFGPERRGAPVLGFTRIDDQKILDRSDVETCDYVVVLDDTLYNEHTSAGLKKDGIMLINTLHPEKFQSDDYKVVTLDATGPAMEILGRPITNVAMLGALLAVSNLVDVESAKAAVADQFPPKIAAKNQQLLEKVYSLVKGAGNVE